MKKAQMTVGQIVALVILGVLIVVAVVFLIKLKGGAETSSASIFDIFRGGLFG